MLKSLLLTAAAWSVVGLAACAAPQPRYAIVPDPLAAAALSPATPPPAAEPEALPLLEAAAVETEVETPRAAPLGRVETTVLAQLPPPAVTPPEASPALSEAPAPAPTSAEATLSHVVGPGDTFFAVGRRYGVGPQAIAELNGLTFASTLRLGQRLQLPAGARDRGAQAAAPGSGPSLAQAGSASPPTAASPVRATVVETEPPAVETPPVVASPPTVAPPVIVPPTSPSAPVAPATAPATAPPPPSAAAPVI
ncbi:MAG: LysM peptidoglycan-binding domain-containing protein, partial [Proteobacteria bacterium]|nr:LysM peptidoglycan-binding domain-containing protein [Pseudomonadota bacterium]